MARLSLFTPSAHLDLGLALQVFESSDHVTSVAQSACLRDIKGIRTVKLFIEFVVVPSPVDTIFDFRAAYHSENLPLKYELLILLLVNTHVSLP
jgi:hypothetical protein